MSTQTILSGVVDADGGIASGEGFTSNKGSATGVYAVNLNGNPYNSPPTVLLSVDTSTEGEQYTACASLHNVKSDSFNVSIQNLAGNSKDFRFNFMCIGE